ncbi:MAG: hypothetical protein JXA00_06215 [Candidatus Thermoplasmatota archaeon]|nr:hypothetical protein [Candidatus Thermoplasmatota archaeon]
MRVSTRSRLVERIVIKIKVFDDGSWDWNVRQRFLREPQMKLDDLLSILDDVKAEIRAAEQSQEPPQEPLPYTTPPVAPPKPPTPQKKRTKKRTTL